MDEDEARFTRIYEENWEDLLAYGLRRAASTEDAADLLAETFLVAWLESCRRDDLLSTVSGLAPSPDGRDVYASILYPSALATFSRTSR